MAKREDVIIQALRDLNQKIDHQYESQNQRLVAIEKIQVKQEENLSEHMRRTDLLEKSQLNIHSELTPIKKHVAFVESALKAIGFLATIVSMAAGIIRIASYL